MKTTQEIKDRLNDIRDSVDTIFLSPSGNRKAIIDLIDLMIEIIEIHEEKK